MNTLTDYNFKVMKKKLEADLISIAHRILKLKNKSELTQLHLETQKLYEKLSVLKFVEDNFSDVKPTIGLSKMEELVASAFDNEEIIAEDEVLLAPAETENEIVSEEIEEEPHVILEEEISEEEEIFEEEAEEPIAAADDKTFLHLQPKPDKQTSRFAQFHLLASNG
jgi:hypothetical protein